MTVPSMATVQVFLGCVACSSAGFTNAAVLLSLAAAMEGRTVAATGALAFAAHAALYPVMLLPAVVLLLAKAGTHKGHPAPAAGAPAAAVGAFALALLTCTGLSVFGLNGSLSFLTVRAHPRRSDALSVPHSKLVLCGAFVWTCRALSRQKRRFLARAGLLCGRDPPLRRPDADAVRCVFDSVP
jgi:hypothetical protein